MESITIKRPVTVKVKVTDSFKKLAAQEVQDGIKKVELELQHLEFQAKRLMAELEKQNPAGISAAKQQLEQQKQKRLEAKTKLMERLKNLAKLAIGEEVVQGTLDTITELKVGDTWSNIYAVEVVVCDNRVIEIRNHGEEVDV